MKRTSPALSTLLLCLMLAGSASASTYYVSSSRGSDSNTTSQAQSKSTPWAHLPGMVSASSNASNYSPVAGDTFILMGCDVWGSSNFPVNWSWSGTTSSPIVVDRDTTWYNTSICPSQWNRPVFDAQNTAMATNMFVRFQNGGNNVTNVTMRWIEAKDLFWTSSNPSGGLAYASFYSADYITLQYWYIHHWTHGSGAGDTDNMVMYQGSSNSGFGCQHCSLNYSIVDNTDGDGADCNGADATCSGGGINIPTQNSVIAGMTNVFKVFTGGNWGFNNISQTNQDFNRSRTVRNQRGLLLPRQLYAQHFRMRRLSGREPERNRLRLEQHLGYEFKCRGKQRPTGSSNGRNEQLESLLLEQHGDLGHGLHRRGLRWSRHCYR
jgi:hypothetical protein